jgi:FkbM family methyltransferase
MIVSYAQNFEDVMLWRALKHVERGFYVDVGAKDPVKDSISLLFYEAGWRGVHVEPSSDYAAKLRSARPDEKVIGAAVGEASGMVTFYPSASTDLSTCDSLLAKQYTGAGLNFQQNTVPCIRLSQIFAECGKREIHWLKIDVEGSEAAVIESWRGSAVRPWIAVVQGVKPGTREPTFNMWESTLLHLGYTFVYFDGLNRFYVSRKHAELARAFELAPNLFDGFTLNGNSSNTFTLKLEQEIACHRAIEYQLASHLEKLEVATREIEVLRRRVVIAEARDTLLQQFEIERSNLARRLADEVRDNAETCRQLEAKIAERNAAARHLQFVIADLQLEVAALRASASWRVTAPLRWVHSKTVARLQDRKNGAAAPVRPNSIPGSAAAAPAKLTRSARMVYRQLNAAKRK